MMDNTNIITPKSSNRRSIRRNAIKKGVHLELPYLF